MERTRTGEHTNAIRCDYDGLKMAEIHEGHLILRGKHHGETHVKIVALAALLKDMELSPTDCAKPSREDGT